MNKNEIFLNKLLDATQSKKQWLAERMAAMTTKIKIIEKRLSEIIPPDNKPSKTIQEIMEKEFTDFEITMWNNLLNTIKGQLSLYTKWDLQNIKDIIEVETELRRFKER